MFKFLSGWRVELRHNNERLQFANSDLAHQVDGDLFTRQTKHIPAAGSLNIEGWLYLPRQPSEKFRESIVLLGHGLGAQKDFGLEMYASMYAAEGEGNRQHCRKRITLIALLYRKMRQ